MSLPTNPYLYLTAGSIILVVIGLIFLMYRFYQSKSEQLDQALASQRRVALFWERLKKFSTEESVQNGLNFKPDPEDVLISTYPKCGTTWTQQIVEMLRSRGNMDFDEICEVQPWITCALDCKQDLSAPQHATPRVFKSHLRYSDASNFTRHIYVLRNPTDVFMSFYKFLPPYIKIFDMTMEEFLENVFRAGRGSRSGCVWDHYESWYPHHTDDNVCWIFFEDLKDDLPACVRKIADFLGIDSNDEELMNMVIEKSSFQFMKENMEKFDEHFTYQFCAQMMELPGDRTRPEVSKVRQGKTGAGKLFVPAEIQSYLDRQWLQQMFPATGCRTYDELRQKTSFLLRNE